MDLAFHYGSSTEEAAADLSRLNVGIGDDVFMMGRFLTHSGSKQKEPVVRFGNIALMPGGEGVRDGRNMSVQAFLVEMHSLSGFSGSPVFLHIPIGSYRGPSIDPPR